MPFRGVCVCGNVLSFISFTCIWQVFASYRVVVINFFLKVERGLGSIVWAASVTCRHTSDQREPIAFAVGLRPWDSEPRLTFPFHGGLGAEQIHMETPQICPSCTTRVVLLYRLTSSLLVNRGIWVGVRRSEGLFACLAYPCPPAPWPLTVHRAANLHVSFQSPTPESKGQNSVVPLKTHAVSGSVDILEHFWK